MKFQIIRRLLLSLQVLVFINLLSGAEEPEVSMQIRTLGWGLQGEFAIHGVGEPLPVYLMQFSEQVRYRGPRLMSLYQAGCGWNDLNDEVILTSNLKHANTSEPALPLHTVQLPNDSERVLLVFSADGYSSELRITPLEDPYFSPQYRKIYFYNITPFELIVRAFGKTKVIEQGNHGVWPLLQGQDQSALIIGVHDNEFRLLFSSRFRLLSDQNMVFFARSKNVNEANESTFPQSISVTPIIFSFQGDNNN